MISKIYLPFEYLPTEVISALTLTVLCMLVFLCASRYAIHRWNAPKRRTNLYFLLCAAVVAIPTGLLYALSERSLQGVVFGLLLSFAAYSDICRREVDDYLSVMIMMVSFFNVPVTKSTADVLFSVSGSAANAGRSITVTPRCYRWCGYQDYGSLRMCARYQKDAVRSNDWIICRRNRERNSSEAQRNIGQGISSRTVFSDPIYDRLLFMIGGL